MGLLDGLLEGAAGAAIVGAVGKLVNDHGGLEGMLNTLQQKGLGGAVQSWVSTGPNQPVTADQLHQALGADQVNALAAQAGMKPADLTQHLAQALPQVVDKLTPQGQVPQGNPLAGGLDALKKLLG